MVRFRNAVLAFLLATGLTGCSAFHGGGNWFGHWSIFHCDTCDDFPLPAYGPGYSMAPGTYTGTTDAGAIVDQSARSTAPAGTAPASPALIPGNTPPPAVTTPPTPPNAPVNPGADGAKE